MNFEQPTSINRGVAQKFGPCILCVPFPAFMESIHCSTFVALLT